MIELLKAVLFGIVEGITEWLPVSSTGHLILLNEFVTLNVSEEFQSMFDVVIQLGAILAVIVLFFYKLNPFAMTKSTAEKKRTWSLWFRVLAAIIPSGVVGVLLDDWMDLGQLAAVLRDRKAEEAFFFGLVENDQAVEHLSVGQDHLLFLLHFAASSAAMRSSCRLIFDNKMAMNSV